MEKIKINENENNDLKYRDGLGSLYNPDQNNDTPITEDTQNNEKLEYFTE